MMKELAQATEKEVEAQAMRMKELEAQTTAQEAQAMRMKELLEAQTTPQATEQAEAEAHSDGGSGTEESGSPRAKRPREE